MKLTQERLKEWVAYNPKTGKFYNKIKRNRAPLGIEVGAVDRHRGCIKINVNYERHYAHRLAWLYEYGYLPENQIDHIDRDPSNNRISNLREVSQVCNTRNCGNPATNKSGVKGIHRNKKSGKWCAQIMVTQYNVYLGRFDDFDEAVCHRLAAEQCLNWEGCDSSSPAYQHVREHFGQGGGYEV